MTKPPATRYYVALFALCLAMNLGFSLVGWNHSLREIHESRQVQTALSARYLQREGWSLDYPLPLFGPPWSAPFEFPTYQYATALIARAAGCSVEAAGRFTALAFFYLALPAFYLLQAFLPIPRERWWLLPSLLLVTPAHLYYSRTVMIESTALCLAAWFLLAFCRALARPGWAWPAVALAAGVAAAVTKLTTFVVFLVPAAAVSLHLLRRPAAEPGARSRGGVTLLAAGLAGAALLSGVLWTRHADAVKAANPLAAGFVSTELQGFVFGPLSQRWDWGFWRQIVAHANVAIVPAANVLLLVLFGFLLTRRARGVVAVLLLCFLAGPVVFANLHAVHDYYFYACGVFAIAALAVSLSELIDLAQFTPAARAAVVLIALGVQASGYAAHYLPAQQRPTPAPPALAAVLREVTAADDVVLILGQEWNPMLAYHADRRAIMVIDRLAPDAWRLDEVLQRVAPRKVTALVVTGEARFHPAEFRTVIVNHGLSDHAVLLGADTHLFVAKPLVAGVRSRMGIAPVAGFTLAEQSLETVSMPRKRFPAASITDPRITSMMNPQPEEIIHPYNLSTCEVDQQLAIDAHAPTDIVFAVPAGSRRAEVKFGILPGAYAGGQPTDGVEFQVALVSADTPAHALFARILTPASVVTDRGTQSASIRLPAGAAGRLVFRTLPGPHGSITSDWAYWARIEIR